MATPKARFASQKGECVVVERTARPVWADGRQTGTEPGKYHYFNDHQLTVEGVKSIEFMREMCKHPSGPGIWELGDAEDVVPAETLLMELATADLARVREILSEEKDGPARTSVVQTAEAILAKTGVSPRNPGAQPSPLMN